MSFLSSPRITEKIWSDKGIQPGPYAYNFRNLLLAIYINDSDCVNICQVTVLIGIVDSKTRFDKRTFTRKKSEQQQYGTHYTSLYYTQKWNIYRIQETTFHILSLENT